jgi:hypothetical protein
MSRPVNRPSRALPLITTVLMTLLPQVLNNHTPQVNCYILKQLDLQLSTLHDLYKFRVGTKLSYTFQLRFNNKATLLILIL